MEYMAAVDGLSAAQMENDDTAWCSCFMNWCVEKAQINGTNSASAQSWKRWRNAKPPESVLAGSDVAAKIGDVAVWERVGAGSGKGHVSIYIATNDDQQNILVLGGNQRNSVRYSWYPINSPAPDYYKLLALRSY